MKVVNLTPHEVKIIGEDGEVKAVFPPSGKVARVSVQRVQAGEINGVPVYANKFGEVENLPEPQPNTVYIVSLLVLQACPDRRDLVAPDTSPQGAVRDEQGRIIGVRGFQIIRS